MAGVYCVRPLVRIDRGEERLCRPVPAETRVACSLATEGLPCLCAPGLRPPPPFYPRLKLVSICPVLVSLEAELGGFWLDEIFLLRLLYSLLPAVV